MASSLINHISENTVMTAGKWQKGGNLLLWALPLIIKVMSGKRVTRPGRGYNNMDHRNKVF